MKSLVKIFLLFSLIALPQAHAENDMASPPRDGHESNWNRAQETAREWWQRSLDGAGDAWSDTQETVEKLWKDTRDTAGGAWDGTRELLEAEDPDHFAEIWDQVLPKLNETLALEERQDELPPSAWFGADQTSKRSRVITLVQAATKSCRNFSSALS